MRRYLLKYAFPTFIIAVAALIFGAAFFYCERSSAQRADVYSTYLRDAHVSEHVSISGEPFSVEFGVVRDARGIETHGANALSALEMAYAMAATRRTPPLALPEIDPSRIETVARELGDAARLLAKEQSNWRDASAIEHDLYPTSFITSAAEAERARRSFLESGTRSSLAVYETALANAQAAYTSDLVRFTRSFKMLVPTDIGRYATDKHLVSRTDIVRTLDALDERIAQINDRVRERERCFHGSVSYCSASDLALPDIKGPLPSNNDGLSHAEHMRSLLQSSGIALSSQRLVKLQDSVCVKDQPGRGLFFSQERVNVPGTSLQYETPFYVGDAFFMDTEQLAELPFYSFFRAQNVRYVLMRPVAFYTCPLADIDIGAVITAQSIASFAGKSPLSTYDSSLTALEKRLLKDDVLEESDALAYLQAGRALLERDMLSQNDSNSLTELLLSSARGNNGMYYTALDIASGEQIELLTKNRGVNTDFSALFRFFPRSGSIILFAGIMNGEERASYFSERPVSKTAQPIIRYSDIISAGVKDKMLMVDIATYARIHAFDE